MNPSRASLPLLLLLLSMLATAVLYGRCLDGPFLFDDQQNIVGNLYVQPASWSWSSLKSASEAYPGFPGRPVSTLSFAINYRLTGLDPAGFKAVNLLIHLLCGLALYGFLLELLTAARERGVAHAPAQAAGHWLAAVTVALWLLHPLQVSTVLYTVQRMAMLAALFSLLGLWAYLRMRRQQQTGRTGWAAALAVVGCLLAGSLSKENGVLLVLYCGMAEAALFRLRAGAPWLRMGLAAVWLGGSAALVLAIALSLPGLSQWLDQGYSGREFSLGERLLTQPRVLLLYLKLLLVPDIGAMTLYHDDLPNSTGWLDPVDTLPALALALSALLACCLGLFGRQALLALAFGLFLAGHALESTVIPLEMAFEHRNYFPSAGLLFGLVMLVGRLKLGASMRPLLAALCLAVFGLLCAQRAQLFSDVVALMQHSLRHHPQSPRTQLWAGDTYRWLGNQSPLERRPAYLETALQHYRLAAGLDPGDVIGLLYAFSVQSQLDAPLAPDAYVELASRLHEGPVRPGSIFAMQAFLEDIADDRSRFPPGEALQLAELLLANPACTGRSRAVILSATATVQTERLQDYASAIALSREAVQLQPQDPSLWIPLATILLKAGRPAEAEAAVLSALAVDRGAFRPSLTRFLATIREQLRPADTRPPSALP